VPLAPLPYPCAPPLPQIRLAHLILPAQQPLSLIPLSLSRGALGFGDGDRRSWIPGGEFSPPLPFSSLSLSLPFSSLRAPSPSPLRARPRPGPLRGGARPCPCPGAAALAPAPRVAARPCPPRGGVARSRPDPLRGCATPPLPPPRGSAPRPRCGVPGPCARPRPLRGVPALGVARVASARPRAPPFTPDAFPRAQPHARGDYSCFLVNFKLR
jgi:hypothetical protein